MYYILNYVLNYVLKVGDFLKLPPYIYLGGIRSHDSKPQSVVGRNDISM
jgi:hypothetical protein